MRLPALYNYAPVLSITSYIIHVINVRIRPDRVVFSFEYGQPAVQTFCLAFLPAQNEDKLPRMYTYFVYWRMYCERNYERYRCREHATIISMSSSSHMAWQRNALYLLQSPLRWKRFCRKSFKMTPCPIKVISGRPRDAHRCCHRFRSCF